MLYPTVGEKMIGHFPVCLLYIYWYSFTGVCYWCMYTTCILEDIPLICLGWNNMNWLPPPELGLIAFCPQTKRANAFIHCSLVFCFVFFLLFFLFLFFFFLFFFSSCSLSSPRHLFLLSSSSSLWYVYYLFSRAISLFVEDMVESRPSSQKWIVFPWLSIVCWFTGWVGLGSHKHFSTFPFFFSLSFLSVAFSSKSNSANSPECVDCS